MVVIDEICNTTTSSLDPSPEHIFQTIANTKLKSEDRQTIEFMDHGKMNEVLNVEFSLVIVITIADPILT